MKALGTSLALAALAGVLACAGSGARGLELGLAPSLLPSLGLAASVSVPVRSGSAWQLEARLTEQFLDDKDFADNGFEGAGSWSQLDLGWLWLPPGVERSWSWRFGLTGSDASGEPNLADEPGEYWGMYAGVGRWTFLAPGWRLGPELTLVAVTGPDERVLVPQLTWGLRYGFGR